MEGHFTEVTPTGDHFVYSMFEGLSRDLWHPFLTGTLGYSEAHAAKIASCHYFLEHPKSGKIPNSKMKYFLQFRAHCRNRI